MTEVGNKAPGEVGRGAADKAVLAACARHRLLAHQRHHLRDVDRGTLRAAGCHDEGGVVRLQAAHAQLPRTVPHLVEHALHQMLHTPRPRFGELPTVAPRSLQHSHHCTGT